MFWNCQRTLKYIVLWTSSNLHILYIFRFYLGNNFEWTNSSKENFQNRLEEFQKHLRERGYPRNLITLTLSEIHFENRKEALRQKPSREKTILPFVTQYQPSVPSLKNILMKHWQLIEKQPLLRQIYKEPPIISYKRGRSYIKTIIGFVFSKNYAAFKLAQSA